MLALVAADELEQTPSKPVKYKRREEREARGSANDRLEKMGCADCRLFL
jgi:hypothetical protein